METKSDEIMSVKEAANFLGLKKSTIYAATSAKTIPHYKSSKNNRVFFKKDELEAWSLNKKVGGIEDLIRVEVSEKTKK